jgi:multiple sugar transport system substrate-binding protein
MTQPLHSFLRCVALSIALLGASTASAQTIEIASGSDNQRMLRAIGDAFEASNPGVKVDVPAGPRSYDDLAQNLLRRATVGQDQPDLLVVGSNLRLYAERGLAVPLDPLLAARPDSEIGKATAAVREKGRVRGTLYGAAIGIAAPVVMFNSDLVVRAGGSPDDLPRDWPAILELAAKVNRLGPPNIGGYFEADNSGSLSLLFLLQSHGGAFMNADETRLGIDTPAGLEGLTLLRSFGEVGQAKAAMTRDQARQAFGAGTIGVFVGTSATIPAAERAAGDRFRVLTIPLPVKPGDGTVPTSGPIASILTKDPARQALALRLIEFALGPKGQQLVAETSGYYPLNQRAIAASTDLKTILDRRSSAPAVLGNLAVADGWYTPPGSQAPRIATIVNDHLLRVATLRTSPEDAAKSLTREIAPFLPSLK